MESGDEGAQNEALLGIERNVAMVAKLSYWQRTSIAVRHESFPEDIGREVGKLHDCFIAELCKDCSKVKCLGCGRD